MKQAHRRKETTLDSGNEIKIEIRGHCQVDVSKLFTAALIAVLEVEKNLTPLEKQKRESGCGCSGS